LLAIRPIWAARFIHASAGSSAAANRRIDKTVMSSCWPNPRYVVSGMEMPIPADFYEPLARVLGFEGD
jgi:hypothetical protein